MKKVLILLFVLFAVSLFAQGKVISVPIIIPESTTITLDSTATSTIYVSFPPPSGPTSASRTAISTTAFSATSAQSVNRVFSSTGDVYVSFVADTSVREESDSLTAWIQPYVYEINKNAWYETAADSTFLVFDTPGTYIATSADYLNWTHGKLYGVPLSNELWPCSGFSITFYAKQFNTAGSQTKLYLTIYFVY